MHLTPSQRCTGQMSGNCGDLVEEDCLFFNEPVWTGAVMEKYSRKKTFLLSGCFCRRVSYRSHPVRPDIWRTPFPLRQRLEELQSPHQRSPFLHHHVWTQVTSAYNAACAGLDKYINQSKLVFDIVCIVATIQFLSQIQCN